MTSHSIKLSKKLFMTLKSGQYIMDNYIDSKYEEIGNNLVTQWDNWRGINGNKITIFDSKEECLKVWWAIHSGLKPDQKTKFVYAGKLSKKIFMGIPNNHYLLFTQEPFEYFEFLKNREKQWLKYKHNNGLMVQIFKNHSDCIMDRNNLLEML